MSHQLDIPVCHMSSHSSCLPVDSMANSVYSVATSAQHMHPWGQLRASAPNLPVRWLCGYTSIDIFSLSIDFSVACQAVSGDASRPHVFLLSSEHCPLGLIATDPMYINSPLIIWNSRFYQITFSFYSDSPAWSTMLQSDAFHGKVQMAPAWPMLSLIASQTYHLGH